MPTSKETISTVRSVIFGAAAGAAALAIIGFNWGGWLTAGTAEKLANLKANVAVGVALASICVKRFKQQPDAVAQLVSFQQLHSHEQRRFVEKGGWASSLGSKESNSAVTKSCAESLAKLSAADMG